MRFVLLALTLGAVTVGVIALLDLNARVRAIEVARAADEPTALLPTPFDPAVWDELGWGERIHITPWQFPDGSLKPR